MPRPPIRALDLAALAALALVALAAFLEGTGRAEEPRRGPGATTHVPEPASLPLTLSGLALLALANHRRLAARATRLAAAVDPS